MPTFARYLPARFKRSVIAPRFLERLKKSQIVVGGPFKGMRYHGEAVCGAAAPKILGVYESELAPFLLRWSTVPFQHIIDVGAAEHPDGRTAAYAIWGLKAGVDNGGTYSMYVEARNIANKAYISSVSVINQANPASPLFEPGSGRAVYAGVKARW